MGYIIPNASSPLASVLDQSEPDSGDFVALGDRKTGVVSGCAVTAQASPTAYVDVASGEVISNGFYYSVSSGSIDLTAGTAGSARFDIVVIDSSGTLTKRLGTAGVNPTFADLQSGDVFLAAVYRAAGTSDTVTSSRIIDKRIFVPSNTARSGAVAPSGGSVGDTYINTSVSSISGQSQYYVKTTSGAWENLAEFAYPGIRQVSGTSDTLQTTDVNNFVEYSGNATVSIPTSSNGNFATGSTIHLVRTGTSSVTVASGGSNVTVNSSLGRVLRTQWSTASLVKRSDGSWLLFGDLTT